MNQDEHFRKLINMYHSAPINQDYDSELILSEGEAEVDLLIKPNYLQSGRSLHGAIFFKVLDEAAAFATLTMEPEFLMVTSSFTTYLTRPVSEGNIRAVGRVLNKTKTQCLAEAIAYNSEGKEVARGSGIFFRSRLPINEAVGYS